MSLSPQHFFVRVIVSFVIATGLWWQVSDLTSRPAAYLAGFTMEKLFQWVDKASVSQNLLEVDTGIKIPVPQDHPQYQALRGATAFMVGEISPKKYGYSLPLLLALLIASPARKRLMNFILGAAVLIPFHSFSIIAALLKDLIVSGGPLVIVQTGMLQWQLELIAFSYQLGTLLLPTLAPIMIWLWLDRKIIPELLHPLVLGRKRDGSAAEEAPEVSSSSEVMPD